MGSSHILTGRFQEIGASFRLLGEILAKEPEELRQTKEMDIWKFRLAESRSAMAEQYLELAQTMESWEQELAGTKDVTSEWSRKLRRRSKELGIHIRQAQLVESGRQKEACLTIAPGSNVINTRELAQSMKGIANCSWRVVPGEQALICGKTSRILLEAETPLSASFSVARRTKKGESTSGDSFSQTWLPRGKALLALCDGMGSGEQAFREGEYALELLERLMEAGYALSTAVRLVHTTLLFAQSGDRHPVAVDGCVLDFWNGMGLLVKAGGAASFLYRDGTVKMLESKTLPAGILTGTEPGEIAFHIRAKDVLIMVTDGVLEAMPGRQKEEYLSRRIERILPCANPAKELLEGIMADYPGGPKDDMTILAAEIGDKNT